MAIRAVVASVGVVGWQAHKDRQRARDDARAERFRHLAAAAELLSGIAQVCELISDRELERRTDSFNSMRSDLGSLVNAVATIDVTRLADRNAIQAILISLGAARRLLADIDAGERESGLPSNVTMAGIRLTAKSMAQIVRPPAVRLEDSVKQAEAPT